MNKFFEDLVWWWNHPVTTVVLAAVGAAVILGGIDRANGSADNAHDRLDAVEKRLSHELGWISARLEVGS
jgi:hypothetical protein